MSESLRAAAARHQQELETSWRDAFARDEGWFDITVPHAVGTPPWPGDVGMTCGWTARLSQGDSINLSAFTVSPHVGTHADAPLHVQEGGRPSDAIPVLPFNGLVHIVDVRELEGPINLTTMRERLPVESPLRVFLRTGSCVADGRFPENWCWLDADAAAAYGSAGLQLLGTDAPSVDARDAKQLITHAACFDRNAWVLENLDLRDVAPGAYELRALPMRLHGLDAAPVRALLRTIA